MFWIVWFSGIVICVWYLLWIFVNKDTTIIDVADEDWMLSMWFIALVPVLNIVLALVAIFHVFHKAMSPSTYKKG